MADGIQLMRRVGDFCGNKVAIEIDKDTPVSAANPLPVEQQGTATVDGTVKLKDEAGTLISDANPLAVALAALLTGDFMFEVASGGISGMLAVNKFGRATNVDNGIDTDVWDGANATDDDDIWIAPTQARIHQIKSSVAGDDGNPAGAGARTLQVYGLTAWNANEVSETITLDGTTNVATQNAYVIIHRMKVLTKGDSGPNIGKITATADVDGTVTAQINAGEGQTQMAIYGIPSTQTAYMPGYYVSAIKGTAGVAVGCTLFVNPEPGSQLTKFLVKHTIGVATNGANYIRHKFRPYFKISGPAIVKIQGNSTANDTDVSAGFDLILVDN